MVFLEPAERGLNIVVANMAHVLARLYWVTPEGGRQPGTSHGVARSLQIATIRVDLSLPISSAIIGYVSGARVHVARTIGNEQECVVAIRIRLVRAIEDTILKHLGRIARQRGRPTPGSRAQEVVPTTTAAHEEDEHFIWVSRVYSKAVGVAEGAAGPQPPDLEARLPPAVRLGGQAAERARGAGRDLAAPGLGGCIRNGGLQHVERRHKRQIHFVHLCSLPSQAGSAKMNKQRHHEQR
mmetsp:Transcript_35582/g.94099  ORF Transcript_35582/g.94099 Transcript_35582/m.94099 type:complete len:239 (+) Transcript_35582:872-1588(+)